VRFFGVNMKPQAVLHHSRSIIKWQAEHLAFGGELFPTLASLHWFIRQHRVELETKQAIIPGRGSRATMLTPLFEHVTAELLVKTKLVQAELDDEEPTL